MATASNNRSVLREYVQTIFLEGAWDDAVERFWERDDLVSLFQGLKREGVHPKFIPILSKTPGVGNWSPETWVEVLEDWDEIAKNNKAKDFPEFEKDVTRYADAFALADAVKTFKDKVSKTQEKKRRKASGSKQVFQDQEWTVLRVDSKEASCEYGRNTKWCISGTEDEGNHFQSYHQESSVNIYFVMHRKSGEKFAVAVYPQEIEGTSKSYYDAQDNELSEGEFRNRLVDLGASDDLLKVLGLQTRDLLKPSPGQLQTRGDQMLMDPVSWVLNPNTDLDNVKLNLLVKVLPALEQAAKTNPLVQKKVLDKNIIPVVQAGDNVLAGLSSQDLQFLQGFLDRHSQGSYRYPYLTRSISFLLGLKDPKESALEWAKKTSTPRDLPGMVRQDPEVLRKLLREVLALPDPTPDQVKLVQECLASGFRDAKKFYKETIGPDLLRGLAAKFPWVVRAFAQDVKDSMTTSVLDVLVDRIFDLQIFNGQLVSPGEMEEVWEIITTYSNPDDPALAGRQLYDELEKVPLGLAIRPFLAGRFDIHQVLAVLTQIRAHGWDAGKWVVDQVLQ